MKGFKIDGRTALSALRLGTELMGKVPRRGDGPFDLLVKGLAMADAWHGIFGRKASTHADLFSRFDLRSRRSEPFVKLFFSTGLERDYKVRRHGVSEHLEFVEAEAPDGERLFFQEHRYGAPEIGAEFYHTRGFDFAAALVSLWGRHRDGLYLSLAPGRHGWGHEATFAALAPDATGCRSRKAGERIVEVARSLQERPRTLLLYGPPGTGKTSLAAGVARHNGGRLLAIDAACLPHLSVQELGFLLESLQPRHLLLDDFDRAPIDDVRSRVLFALATLKTAGVSSFITVNDASRLDAAMLRSGRIDGALELPLPDAEERGDILARLGLGADLVSATDGWCHADLDALAERARVEPVAEAMADMRALRDLAAKAVGSQTTGPSDPPKAP
jgi:hypothetical protein